MISVQRFEQWMVPRFCWFDLRLAESLYNMYGVPVSICDSKMRNHSCCAFTVCLPLPWASNCVYTFSNSSPHISYRPLPVSMSTTSLGQNNVQSASSFTRCMKRSGTQRP